MIIYIDKLGNEVIVKSDNVFESLVNKGVIIDDTLIKESIRGKWIKAIENNKYSALRFKADQQESVSINKPSKVNNEENIKNTISSTNKEDDIHFEENEDDEITENENTKNIIDEHINIEKQNIKKELVNKIKNLEELQKKPPTFFEKVESLFIKFWKGEITLWKSFWIVGVIISNIAAVIIGFIVGFIFAIIGLEDYVLSILPFFVIPMMIYFFFGIWRSADKYKGPKGWTYAAKFFIVIGTLIGFIQIFGSIFA